MKRKKQNKFRLILLLLGVLFFSADYYHAQTNELNIQGTIGGSLSSSSSSDSVEPLEELPKTAQPKQSLITLKQLPRLGNNIQAILWLAGCSLCLLVILWRWQRLKKKQ